MSTTEKPTEPSQPTDRRRPSLTECFFLLAGLSIGGLELWRFFSSVLATRIDFFADDAYYYFEIAWNWSHGLGPTFDTLSPTNGFHPLWTACLTLLAWLSPDRFTFLGSVVVLSATSLVFSLFLVGRLFRPLGMISLVSPIALLFVYQRRLWFNGMESALLLLLMLLTLTLLARRWRTHPDSLSVGDDWKLGLCLLLMVFSRLDTIFLAGPILVLDLIRQWTYQRRSVRNLLPSLPLAVGLPLYMVINRIVFGLSSPISGYAKSLGPTGQNFDIVERFLHFTPMKAPVLRNLDLQTWFVFLVIPAFLLVIGTALRGSRKTRSQATVLLSFLVLVLVANLAQLLYYATQTTWPLWRWYYYYLPIWLMLTIASLLFPWRHLARRQPIWSRVLLSTVALLCSISIFRHAIHVGDAPKNYKRAAVEIADFLNRETPADSVFAMGDRAGSIGFLLDRPLVQLEGLVNSLDYLEALQEGRIAQFLDERSVDYLIYSGGELSGGEPEPIQVDSRICHQFFEPKAGRGPKATFVVCPEDLIFESVLETRDATGGRTQVWKYRPELQTLGAKDR